MAFSREDTVPLGTPTTSHEARLPVEVSGIEFTIEVAGPGSEGCDLNTECEVSSLDPSTTC